MYELIYDEEQVLKFLRLLKPLVNDESYFLSMSGRNKYLTEEERIAFDLGRTEMFARKLVKRDLTGKLSPEQMFLRTLKSMQVSDGGYTTRTGKGMPMKCLVVYANINPVSGFKALRMFYEKTTAFLFDTCTNPNASDRINSLDTLLMNCYQKSRSEKYLIDIDFDIPNDDHGILENFCNELVKIGVVFNTIKTHSGFHVLLKRDTIKFNYTVLIKAAHEDAVKFYGKDHVEVVINTNEMVPIPGTLQAGTKVHFL
jgi:hypothetical protein